MTWQDDEILRNFMRKPGGALDDLTDDGDVSLDQVLGRAVRLRAFDVQAVVCREQLRRMLLEEDIEPCAKASFTGSFESLLMSSTICC